MTLPAASPEVSFARGAPEPTHTGAVLRLRAIVEEEAGFRFVVAVFGNSAYRDRLIHHLDMLVKHGRVLDIADMNDFESVDEGLTVACGSASLVHVTGARTWLSDESRAAELLHGLNYRREGFAARCESTVVFWLDERSVRQLARHAPDLWAWRAGLLSFVGEPLSPSEIKGERVMVGRVDAQSMRRRLKDIRTYLQQHDERLASHVLLLLEMAEIEISLGCLNEAEKSAFEARQLAVHHDDRFHEAVGWGLIANISETRGDLEEALRIRREEEVPVYERLGDVRSLAMTKGKIADILRARGDLEEAMRIRLEEEVPVYEQLGNVRELAIARGKVADAIEIRGDLEEALRIRCEEEVPVYEQLGDVRELAIARGKIAGILATRGELERSVAHPSRGRGAGVRAARRC